MVNMENPMIRNDFMLLLYWTLILFLEKLNKYYLFEFLELCIYGYDNIMDWITRSSLVKEQI